MGPSTLVLYGSARKKGQTKAMLDLFLQALGKKAGTVEIIDCYRTEVSPCIDCRHCWKERRCAIQDGMREIYDKVDAADNIIIAAPVYFNSLPGKMKVLIDRFQMFWASEVRGDKPKELTKKGAGLIVGGAPFFNGQFTGSEVVITGLFDDFRAENLGIVTFSDTDNRKVDDDADTRQAIQRLAERL
jgi:multimeric flavodoxin WrbA